MEQHAHPPDPMMATRIRVASVLATTRANSGTVNLGMDLLALREHEVRQAATILIAQATDALRGVELTPALVARARRLVFSC